MKTITTLFLTLLLPAFIQTVYAGQDTIDTSRETKDSIGTKLDVCLKSNIININNYKNLQVLYANLLSEKKLLEQKLKTLEETRKDSEQVENLTKEKSQAISEAQEYKKNARYIFYLLVGALIALGLNKYFSAKARYHLVAENYSLARLFGALGFIFLGTFIALTVLFLYYLLRLVF